MFIYCHIFYLSCLSIRGGGGADVLVNLFCESSKRSICNHSVVNLCPCLLDDGEGSFADDFDKIDNLVSLSWYLNLLYCGNVVLH